MPPPHSLEPTDGIWLISLVLETILYGMGLLQVWLYFHWYPKDSWGLKLVVILLAIVETLQVIWYTQSLYIYVIKDFGNLIATGKIHWSGSAQLGAIYVSAAIVQLYFAYCLYALSRKNLLVTMLIVALAFLQVGSGFAQDVISGRLLTFDKLSQTKAIHELQAAATLVCDVLITIALCVTLNRNKAGIKSTNTVLQKLMVNAINRGTLTSICAIINFILFLAKPDTLYYMLGLQMSSKLYMNSMLATLNSRQYIRRQTGYDQTQSLSFAVSNSQAASRPAPESISISNFSEAEAKVSKTAVQKQTFVSDMI